MTVVVPRGTFVTFDRCGSWRAVSLVGACWGVAVEEVGPVTGNTESKLWETVPVFGGD